jgi:ankyrin repeat protein
MNKMNISFTICKSGFHSIPLDYEECPGCALSASFSYPDDFNILEYMEESENMTLLMKASHGGLSPTTEIMEILISYGANPNTINNEGNTALTIACATRNDKAIILLLDNGADANIGSPLAITANREDVWLVRLLLEKGANPNATDRHGKSALLIARYNERFGKYRIMEMLLDAGANTMLNDNEKNRLGKPYVRTFLQFCVHKRDYQTTSMLLKRSPVPDLNERDDRGNTILHIAVLEGWLLESSYLFTLE